MRIAPSALTAIAIVALAGCAAHSPHFRPHDGGRVGAATFKVAKCSAGNCKVNVTVSDDGTHCAGQVDIQVLDVRLGGHPRRGEKVEFSLPGGSPYKFVETAVSGRSPLWIKSGADPFVSVPTVQSSGKKLVAELKEVRSGDLIEYGIRFARDQSPLQYCLDVDPWMVD